MYIHYHPIEAMIMGVPVVFSSKSLLTTYIKDSPAIYNDINHAKKIIDKILKDDKSLINSIIKKQNEILEEFTVLKNNKIFSILK